LQGIMTSKSLVEAADRKSRMRAAVFAAGTLVFLLVQVMTRPPFETAEWAQGWRLYAWMANAVLLLACLATGGGLVGNQRIRALINDEVSRNNYRTACIVGFWVVMITGLVTYVVPALQSLTGDQSMYLVVTLGTVTSLLTFSWLELRAHADA
jgi:hypothetical protein